MCFVKVSAFPLEKKIIIIKKCKECSEWAGHIGDGPISIQDALLNFPEQPFAVCFVVTETPRNTFIEVNFKI